MRGEGGTSVAGTGTAIGSSQALIPSEGSSPHARGGLEKSGVGGHGEGLIPACAGRARRPSGRSTGSSAHPRMRGEGDGSCTQTPDKCGSSPHARGGLFGGVLRGPGERLIPACAGRAPGPWPSTYRGSAHPRMRGEGMPPGVLSSQGWGSSPHARGGLREVAVCGLRVRLIPACAGRATCPCRDGLRSWAHPRMRGEGCSPRSPGSWGSGSSPHARGGPVP